jgi:hypothetical protein
VRVSGSRFHLALACSYAFRSDVRVVEREPGAAAVIGSEAHGYVEAKALGLPPPPVSEDAQRIGERACAWLDDVDIPTAVEIAIVYDAGTDTARRVHLKGHREYGELGQLEIPTTLDLLWDLPEEDCVVIRDLKTGKKEHAHMEQLEIQALAATRLLKRSKARVGFLWARKTKTEADPLVELSAVDLEAAAWRVASVMLGIPTAQPITGQHCWLCPLGRSACPAFQEPTEEERMEMTGT